jgi:hypothetical protein
LGFFYALIRMLSSEIAIIVTRILNNFTGLFLAHSYLRLIKKF